MIAVRSPVLPVGAALGEGLRRIMEIVLHIGAHRTGTTTAQQFLRENRGALGRAGIAYWGPRDTRRGLFAGILPTTGGPGRRTGARRARGRVLMGIDAAARAGHSALLVSDENMIGSVRENLRGGALYPAIGERLARFAAAFDHRITRVVMSVRGQDRFWASSMAYGIARGMPVPKPARLDRIMASARSWRAVVQDVACALPRAELRVIPFETHMADPRPFLARGCGLQAPLAGHHGWLNEAPHLPQLRDVLADRGEDPAQLPAGEGRWWPFDAAQVAQLREFYADDLFWLRAGADGLATLVEEDHSATEASERPAGIWTRGHQDEREESALDRTG